MGQIYFISGKATMQYLIICRSRFRKKIPIKNEKIIQINSHNSNEENTILNIISGDLVSDNTVQNVDEKHTIKESFL